MKEHATQARALCPVGNAAVLATVAILAALGMYQPDDLVDDMRGALTAS